MSSIQWQQQNSGSRELEHLLRFRHDKRGCTHCTYSTRKSSCLLFSALCSLSWPGSYSRVQERQKFCWQCSDTSWGSASCVAGSEPPPAPLAYPAIPGLSQSLWSHCCCIYSPAVSTDCSQQGFVLMPWALTSDGSREDTSVESLCRGNYDLCWRGSVDVVGEREL